MCGVVGEGMAFGNASSSSTTNVWAMKKAVTMCDLLRRNAMPGVLAQAPIRAWSWDVTKLQAAAGALWCVPAANIHQLKCANHMSRTDSDR